MIELTWNTALLLYLLLLLLALFSLWIFTHFRQKGRKITLSTENIAVCEYCHNTYISHLEDSLSRCPACNSLNKKS